MNETINRVATAIQDAANDATQDDRELGCSWAMALAATRAAIEAIRGPTDWRIDTEEGKAIRARRLPAYIAVCRQSNCMGRGFNETDCGNCAACADTGDDVIESYLAAITDTTINS